MKKLLGGVINIGIAEGETFVMRNRLRVFNTAIFVVFFISCFYCFTAFTHDYILSSYATGYSIVSCLLTLFFVHKRKYVFAYHFAMWYGFIFLSAFTLLFGSATNSHLYFLFLPIACLILFDDKRTNIFYFILSVIITLLNFMAVEEIEPYYIVSEEEAWLAYPNVPFVLILIFLSVRMFKNENRKYAVKIEDQKAAIEETNKAITDSINYARKIQSALLAPAALMKKHLPQQFILCVGDCTGHGVPGAFMSLLNISIMRELIADQKIDRPDLLLNKQREQIIRSLNPDGAEEKGKDGMDCVVAKFDFANNIIEFACANNPVWIWRDDNLHEFKADKQPVGIHEGETKPFSLHQWESKSGDVIYLFTDGFADQFGGPRGKKFKYAQLKDKVASLGNLSLENRGKMLDTAFTEWKGNLEQVDDVLIIGIQL
jgi:sigma-B regulation protein RsbU (phosphoserine phosphatase)